MVVRAQIEALAACVRVWVFPMSLGSRGFRVQCVATSSCDCARPTSSPAVAPRARLLIDPTPAVERGDHVELGQELRERGDPRGRGQRRGRRCVAPDLAIESGVSIRQHPTAPPARSGGSGYVRERGVYQHRKRRCEAVLDAVTEVRDLASAGSSGGRSPRRRPPSRWTGPRSSGSGRWPRMARWRRSRPPSPGWVPGSATTSWNRPGPRSPGFRRRARSSRSG